MSRHCITSRQPASKAFSLVEMTVMVLLVALLAGGAAFYYQRTASDTRLSIAQEETNRIAAEISRWTLTPNHKFPRTTADLPRLGNGHELYDPWGTPYTIHRDLGIVASAGPDKLTTTVDDLISRFAPPQRN